MTGLIVPKEEAAKRAAEQAQEAQDNGTEFMVGLMTAHAQAISDALRPVLVEILVRIDMLARLQSGQRPKTEVVKQLNEKDREVRKAQAQMELARIEAEAAAEMERAEAEDENDPHAADFDPVALAEARVAEGDA